MKQFWGYIIYGAIDLLSLFNKTEEAVLTRSSFLVGYFIMDITLSLFVLLFPTISSNFTICFFIVMSCFGLGNMIHYYYMHSNLQLQTSWEKESALTKKKYKTLSVVLSFASTILLFVVLFYFRKSGTTPQG